MDFSKLKSAAKIAAETPIFDRFSDPERARAFSINAGDMLFDYSKTSIDAAGRQVLLDLYDAGQVDARREAMFRGDKINETEGRAVLHTALRNLDGPPVMLDGADVMPGVLETLQRMEAFAADVREGRFVGEGGKITDVVNIGIGGSDLGPAMATLALAPYHDGPRCHYVSNVDAAHIADTLRGIDPRTTLVIVAPKTFTSIETMTNAATAKVWMSEKVTNPAVQFAALSTAADKTAAFGIDASRVFGFEDWVGGRYSIWGPIGLGLMIATGADSFRAFLKGGQWMDTHFRAAVDRARKLTPEDAPIVTVLSGATVHWAP